jgi:hypothetical protein
MDRALQCVPTRAMHDLFELVFEYRSLLARRKSEGNALDLPVRRRLDALHRLLGREPVPPDPDGSGEFSRRRHARCEVDLAAAFRIGDRRAAISVSNLGAGGVCVVAQESLEAGIRGVLRIRCPDSGRIYECVAQVAWSRPADEGDDHLAGLRFVGAPHEVRLAS